MSPTKLVLLVAGLAALPFAAHAGTAADAPTVRVQFSDLDLSHDAGIERLYTRLRHAANTACGEADLRDMRGTANQHACAKQALDRAVSDIHSSRLSARHALGAAASSVAMRD